MIDEEMGLGINWSITNELLKCLGCDDVVMRQTTRNSEDYNEVQYFPPTIQRQMPDWIGRFPHDNGETFRKANPKKAYIGNLLRQIYIALNNDCPALAVMGIRGLLEHVMIDRVGDQGTFADNLKEFEKQGFVGAKQRKQLEGVLEIGHAAIHRSYEPNKAAVDFALGFTETLLQNTYLHDVKVVVPSRRRKRP